MGAETNIGPPVTGASFQLIRGGAVVEPSVVEFDPESERLRDEALIWWNTVRGAIGQFAGEHTIDGKGRSLVATEEAMTRFNAAFKDLVNYEYRKELT